MTKKKEHINFFENSKPIRHCLKGELSPHEMASIDFVTQIYHARGLLQLVRENPTKEEKAVAKFFEDMWEDCYAERKNLYVHWVDGHEIREIMEYLFPERCKTRSGYYELYHDFLSLIIEKDEDIPVISYKLESEGWFQDYRNAYPPCDNEEPKPIHTYFLECESTSNIKIGRSVDPKKRFKALSTSSPTVIRILGVIEKDVETELHRKFKESRLQGEWFGSTPELLEYIKENTIPLLIKD